MNTRHFHFNWTTFTTSVRTALGGIVVALLLFNSNSAMAGDCKPVITAVSSHQVGQFSDGTPCPTGQICTEGRFIGIPYGKFRFHGTGAPYPAFLVDPQLPPAFTGPPSFSTPWLVFATGEIRLDTPFCGTNGSTGTLVIRDATTFAITAYPLVNPTDPIEGPFGDVGWVDGAASTGTCAGASGLLVGAGRFNAGCVDCAYKGQICRP